MRISAVAFFMILTTVFLSGCGKDDMAALDDHGTSFYSRNGVLSLNAPMRDSAMDYTSSNISVSSNTGYASSTTPSSMPFSHQKPADARGATATASGAWQWPVNGRLVETYGAKADGVTNEGIIIAAPEGTPIKAAQGGEVAFVGEDARNYGNIVIIRHADGGMASYSHTKSIVVKKGERVNAGSTIAYVGQTGNAKTPQLHFAVRENRMAVDPMTKLPHQVASN